MHGSSNGTYAVCLCCDVTKYCSSMATEPYLFCLYAACHTCSVQFVRALLAAGARFGSATKTLHIFALRAHACWCAWLLWCGRWSGSRSRCVAAGFGWQVCCSPSTLCSCSCSTAHGARKSACARSTSVQRGQERRRQSAARVEQEHQRRVAATRCTAMHVACNSRKREAGAC